MDNLVVKLAVAVAIAFPPIIIATFVVGVFAATAYYGIKFVAQRKLRRDIDAALNNEGVA